MLQASLGAVGVGRRAKLCLGWRKRGAAGRASKGEAGEEEEEEEEEEEVDGRLRVSMRGRGEVAGMAVEVEMLAGS
ncbi:hypothetical protein GTR04_7097 [Trichophyton interdigitale]|nr:hypothetical protein GY631_6756 [Trichophyton interdigitale]KAG8205520.1 hypothetical protein GTR04_7097 [Trichophyton interdigitale]